MFGAAYFGKHYFGGSYWGPGGAAPIPPPTPSVDLGLGHRSMRSLKHHKRLYDEREARKLEIRALYEEAAAVPETRAQAADAVRRYADSEAAIPGVSTIDWKALKRDAETVNVIVEIWVAHLRKQEDEDIEQEDEDILLWRI